MVASQPGTFDGETCVHRGIPQLFNPWWQCDTKVSENMGIMASENKQYLNQCWLAFNWNLIKNLDVPSIP